MTAVALMAALAVGHASAETRPVTPSEAIRRIARAYAEAKSLQGEGRVIYGDDETRFTFSQRPGVLVVDRVANDETRRFTWDGVAGRVYRDGETERASARTGVGPWALAIESLRLPAVFSAAFFDGRAVATFARVTGPTTRSQGNSLLLTGTMRERHPTLGVGRLTVTVSRKDWLVRRVEMSLGGVTVTETIDYNAPPSRL